MHIARLERPSALHICSGPAEDFFREDREMEKQRGKIR
jgi:hypothetical protein